MLRPLQPRKDSGSWMVDGDVYATAISLAGSIIEIFAEVLDSQQLYHFPFIQYLIGAASIILGIVARKPFFRQHYRQLVASAIRMIQTFCQKTWVSGRTARTVERLRNLAAIVFDNRMDTEPATTLANGFLPSPETWHSSESTASSGSVRPADGGPSCESNPTSRFKLGESRGQQIHQEGCDSQGKQRRQSEHISLSTERPQDAVSRLLPALENVPKTYQGHEDSENAIPLVMSDFAFEADIGCAFGQNIPSWDQTLQSIDWDLNAVHHTPSDFLADATFDFNPA